jgi:hypothetical protein
MPTENVTSFLGLPLSNPASPDYKHGDGWPTALDTALQLIDAWASGQGAGGGFPNDVQKATVTIDAADLLNMDTVPVFLLAAPGAGKVIIPIHTTLECIAGSQPYSQIEGSPYVWFVYGSAPQASGAAGYLNVSAQTDFSQTSNQITFGAAAWNAEGGVSPSAGAANQPIYAELSQAINDGPISASTLGAGGSGYAPGDTGIINGSSDNTATYVIDTVDGGGAVLTYHLTSGGTLNLYGLATGVATATGGAQPGGGDGTFTVNITGVTTGNGSLILTLWYTIQDISVVLGEITASTLASGGDVTAHPTVNITAGHAGSGYLMGDSVQLVTGSASFHVTGVDGGGGVTSLSRGLNGTGCVTGAGQATSSGSGTGLELDVTAVDGGWNVSDTFVPADGNNDATGHVTAVDSNHLITAYAIDTAGTGYNTADNPVEIGGTAFNQTATINVTAVA